jgi:ABC-type antimicrobial peptide transport system permease subunit
VSNSFVSPGFFRALGLPLLQGRDFDGGDRATSPRVAVVNETFARRAFGRATPLGRRFGLAGSTQFEVEIVGVIKDLRYEHLREAAPDGVFFPLAQMPADEAYVPTPTGLARPRDLTVIVRARPGARLSAGEIGGQLALVEPRAALTRIWTFDEEAGRALSQERLLAWLGSVFGSFALILLMIGLYGTLTAAVNRSRREIGIRIALGASPLSLRAMVVVRSVAVVCCGLAAGLPFSYAAARSFGHVLHGVRPIEPAVGAAVAGLVLVTTAVSTYLPARKAARVDPLVALREE